MSFSSNEINFLIYRYLLESHFIHSARVFGAETGADQLSYDGSRIQTAALLELLRKGIWFTEAQISIDDSGKLRRLKKGLKLSDAVIPEKYEMKRKKILQRCPFDNEKPTNRIDPDEDIYFSCHVKLMKIQDFNVCTCAWNPTKNFLAFGSFNSLIKLWNFDKPEDAMISFEDDKDDHPVKENFSVTVVDWSPDGNLIAVGFSDGLGKIWEIDGKRKCVLKLHKSAVISIKWNKKQSFVLTGSADFTTIVWEGVSGKIKQRFAFHESAVLDVDWQSDDIFASSSVDRYIYVCKVGQFSPIRTFIGHEGEINEIKWDPYARILASCSDDKTVRLWSIQDETNIFKLTGHKKEVHSISWGLPTLPDASCKKCFLISASFDHTVRLWEPLEGTCIAVFKVHTNCVYSVAFSPDGCFFATASSDHYIFVLDIETSSVIYSYKSISGFVKVCWNHRGDVITGIGDDGSMCVLHLQNFLDEQPSTFCCLNL